MRTPRRRSAVRARSRSTSGAVVVVAVVLAGLAVGRAVGTDDARVVQVVAVGAASSPLPSEPARVPTMPADPSASTPPAGEAPAPAPIEEPDTVPVEVPETLRPASRAITPGVAHRIDLALEHDGLLRTGVGVVPDGLHGLPLVIALHGAGSDGMSFLADTGLDQLADVGVAVVLAPDGIDQTWNAGGCCLAAVSRGIDDVGYLRRLIGEAAVRYGADPRRVLLVGFSNGGMVAYAFACAGGLDAPQTSGVVAVAAALVSDCTQPPPGLNIMHVYGVHDTFVPASGLPPTLLETGQILEYEPLMLTISRWLDASRCGAPEPAVNNDWGTVQEWPCSAGTNIVLANHPGGHNWPERVTGVDLTDGMVGIPNSLAAVIVGFADRAWSSGGDPTASV
jgi:polyhydroxybutyrate depolymerase